mgnify:CR=1 FL=1
MKAKNNRTIELTESEKEYYSKKFLHPNDINSENCYNSTICSNVFDAINKIPNNSIDLLITDPPYNMTKEFGRSDFKKIKDVEYRNWMSFWFSKVLKKLKSNASIYICSDWKTSPIVYSVLKYYKLNIQNRITWEREKGRGSKYNWKNSSEDIWFATVSDDYYFNVDAVKMKRKVKAPYKENGEPKDWKVESNGNYRLTHPSNFWSDISVPFWSMPENTNHPTQKSEKLIAKLILASSIENDTILDPFVGSGTTSVVAKKFNRNYIGVELDNYYCCITEKRLYQTNFDKSIQGFKDNVFWERNSK